MRDRDARLVEFSFSSRLAAGQSAAMLMQLARQIWRDNTRAGLTGMIRLCGPDLDQTVEGPSAVILPLSARILTDTRHGEIAIRRFGPIAGRSYAAWHVEGFERPPAIRAGRAANCGNLRLLAPAAAVRCPEAALRAALAP